MNSVNLRLPRTPSLPSVDEIVVLPLFTPTFAAKTKIMLWWKDDQTGSVREIWFENCINSFYGKSARRPISSSLPPRARRSLTAPCQTCCCAIDERKRGRERERETKRSSSISSESVFFVINSSRLLDRSVQRVRCLASLLPILNTRKNHSKMKNNQRKGCPCGRRQP